MFVGVEWIQITSNRRLTFWAEDFLRLRGFALDFTIVIKLWGTLPAVYSAQLGHDELWSVQRTPVLPQLLGHPILRTPVGPKFAHKSHPTPNRHLSPSVLICTRFLGFLGLFWLSAQVSIERNLGAG